MSCSAPTCQISHDQFLSGRRGSVGMGHGDLQLHEATAGTERLSRLVLTKILFKMFYNMFRPNALSSCPHVASLA